MTITEELTYAAICGAAVGCVMYPFAKFDRSMQVPAATSATVGVFAFLFCLYLFPGPIQDVILTVLQSIFGLFMIVAFIVLIFEKIVGVWDWCRERLYGRMAKKWLRDNPSPRRSA